MTVTLALVALTATLVLPRLADRGAAGVTATAEAVAQRLTAARWQAVIEGRPVRVSLAALGPGLQATEEVPGSAAGSGARTIAFAPLPAALPRTIVLTDARGGMARITIPAGLGSLVVAVEPPS